MGDCGAFTDLIRAGPAWRCQAAYKVARLIPIAAQTWAME